MSANLKKTKTEKEKTAGSEGEEGGGAHLRYTQKPNKAGRDCPHPEVSACQTTV